MLVIGSDSQRWRWLAVAAGVCGGNHSDDLQAVDEVPVYLKIAQIEGISNTQKKD